MGAGQLRGLSEGHGDNVINKIHIVSALFALAICGAIVFCWWLARIGLGQVGVGILSGCLLVTTYQYLRIVN